MSRREFLTGVISSVSLATAGCLSARSEEFDPDVTQETRLGAAPSISVSAATEREYEYLEASNQVRLHYDSGDSSTMAFERFGTHRAVDHGSDKLREILQKNDLTGTGISVGSGELQLNEIDSTTNGTTLTEADLSRDAPMAPMVSHSHHYARDGSLISTPDHSFEALVQVVPRTLDVTVRFPEQHYTAVVPGVCEKGWYKNE